MIRSATVEPHSPDHVVVRAWLEEMLTARSNVSIVEPGRRHLPILEEVISRGPIGRDAHYGRFPKLKWVNPLG